MYRDRRLRGLSSDHHHALVLARDIRRQLDQPSAASDLLTLVRREFEQELAPHFEIEEELLLPALREVGLADFAERTQAEHDELRGHLQAAERGEFSRLMNFARKLEAHVRFEERKLFPACEEKLDAAVLEAVMMRSPPPGERRDGVEPS